MYVSYYLVFFELFCIILYFSYFPDDPVNTEKYKIIRTIYKGVKYRKIQNNTNKYKIIWKSTNRGVVVFICILCIPDLYFFFVFSSMYDVVLFRIFNYVFQNTPVVGQPVITLRCTKRWTFLLCWAMWRVAGWYDELPDYTKVGNKKTEKAKVIYTPPAPPPW